MEIKFNKIESSGTSKTSDDILLGEDNLIEMAPSNWVPITSMIKIVGVGGGGCNAVSYMYKKGFTGCQFYVCNTDYVSMERSNVPNQIRIGTGLGAGTRPDVGRKAAVESTEAITNALVDENTRMVFITASLGGGTGTGAAPVVASICKDAGILTIGVVTLPFSTESRTVRMKALDGLEEMRACVDSLIVIDNNKLYDHCGNLSIMAAFNMADDVLATAVSGVLGIIEKTGYINVDLNDVQAMMRDSGMALMGRGSGRGKNRVDDALREATSSPLLNDYDLKKATKVLVNITNSSSEQGLTMDELQHLEDAIGEKLSATDNYKKGIVFSDDPDFGDRLDITIIATGVDMMGSVPEEYQPAGAPEDAQVTNFSEGPKEAPAHAPEVDQSANATGDNQASNSSEEPSRIGDTSPGNPTPSFIRKFFDTMGKFYDESGREV